MGTNQAVVPGVSLFCSSRSAVENICGGPVRRAVSAPGRAHLRVESERSRSSFSTGTNTSSFEVLNNAYDVAAGEHSEHPG